MTIQLSERIKELRTSMGLSQADLASKVNVSMHTVFRWEKGQNQPNAQELSAISAFFNVSADYLLGKTSNPECISSETEVKRIRLAEELNNMVRDLSHDNPEISILMRNTAEHWDELNDIEKQSIADGIAFVLGRTNADIEKRLKKESRHGRL